ncbi:GNAT family N-acetyltransferase [Paenibacillus soyae]|uniref:GNAT family N-acetyltransferase n=1 Tax=Paenibacillus soyae TaxID=2969249 RepID=A0A9X2MRS5_9BACL|nr:GNAT family N-acetyltransferase [Paenibacillus soyae]MCR2807103.1 GNAT family N-acetyltransferase [Paenibacillus soyae]
MTAFVFPTIDTERLTLRLLTLEDAPAVYRHFSQAEVTRFMDIPPCKDMREAEDIIQFHIDDSGCRWGLFDRETGQLAGTCGYHCWVSGPEARAEIGFDLSTAYWGQGLMGEALRPVLELGFTRMGLERVEATVEPGNVRSIRLLEKLGFHRHEEPVQNLIYFDLKRKDIHYGA